MTIGTKSSADDRKTLSIESKKERSRQGKGFFWEARTRILAWYSILMTGFIGLSIPVFSELVFSQVHMRVRDDLVAELASFEEFVAEQSSNSDKITEDRLKEIFREFLYRQIPEDDTFLITFVGGEFFRSSPRGRPEQLQEESPLMRRWAKLTKNEQVEQPKVDRTLGNILYLATPIVIDGQQQGVFVIAHTTGGEIEEAQTVILTVTQVLVVGLVLALILAWMASGKVLEPLRSLVFTARLISESNLNKRIPVHGSGEMGELAITFNKMLDRLQETLTTQKAFINDAGHELRTPITIVRGHLELLGDDPQEQQETIELVTDELDRMSRMVDDLILLAKSERSDFLQLETIDLAALTQELYTKATALADRDWKLDAVATCRIVGDRQRLTQAVMNLTDNATQYTAATDAIAIGSAIDRQTVRLWVRDTGMGIAEGDRQKIFERFARASNSRRRSESIVRAIAEAHGGRIELISELRVGSTFTLILPLEPPQEVKL
jgi:signal transduction histidine kinase